MNQKVIFGLLIILFASCSKALIMTSGPSIGFSKKGLEMVIKQPAFANETIHINHRDSCQIYDQLKMIKIDSLDNPLDNYSTFELTDNEIWFISNYNKIDSSIAGDFYLLEILKLKYKSESEIVLELVFLKNLERRIHKIGVVELSEIEELYLIKTLNNFSKSIESINQNCQNE